MNATSASVTRTNGFVKAVFKTWLLAGTLDGLSAIIHMMVLQRPPLRVFQYVSSGLLGPSAFQGGTVTIVLGIALHYIIALIWTFIFFLIYPVFPWLSRNQIITGILYGIVVWFWMNMVILPLSNITPKFTPTFPSALLACAILIVAIGLPISVMAHRFYTRKPV